MIHFLIALQIQRKKCKNNKIFKLETGNFHKYEFKNDQY